MDKSNNSKETGKPREEKKGFTFASTALDEAFLEEAWELLQKKILAKQEIIQLKKPISEILKENTKRIQCINGSVVERVPSIAESATAQDDSKEEDSEVDELNDIEEDLDEDTKEESQE